MMSALGPVSGADMNRAMADELARRNAETMNTVNGFIGQHPKEWNELVARAPRVAELPAETHHRGPRPTVTRDETEPQIVYGAHCQQPDSGTNFLPSASSPGRNTVFEEF